MKSTSESTEVWSTFLICLSPLPCPAATSAVVCGRISGMGMQKESAVQITKIINLCWIWWNELRAALMADVRQQEEACEQLEERSWAVLHATDTAVCWMHICLCLTEKEILAKSYHYHFKSEQFYFGVYSWGFILMSHLYRTSKILVQLIRYATHRQVLKIIIQNVCRYLCPMLNAFPLLGRTKAAYPFKKHLTISAFSYISFYYWLTICNFIILSIK